MNLDVSVVLVQICRHFRSADAMEGLAVSMRLKDSLYTKSVSLDASLSTGIMNRKKKIERIANPLAVRVY
jgi:hypothetical protein